MRINRNISPIIAFIVCTCLTAWSQAATPEAALEEMATTTKAEDVEKHLPAKFLRQVDELSPKERAEFLQMILISNHFKNDKLQLHKTGDGKTWEVVQDDGVVKGTIVLKNSFFSGDEAMVLVQAIEKKGEDLGKAETLVISMRLEDGEWRVTGGGDFHEFDFESETILGKFRHSAGNPDANVTAFLRSLNTSLMIYANTYQEIGLPASLDVLGGEEGSEASSEHAHLILGLSGNLVVRDGYEFQYTRIDSGKYRITARPVELEKTGGASFFTDESAVIRSTKENRNADENDPPYKN